MTEPLITSTDKASALWRTLSAHYTARLLMLREQNDQRKSPEDTAYLRGQIAEIKEFMRLGEDRPQRLV